MTDSSKKEFDALVLGALDAPAGQAYIVRAEHYLLDQLRRSRFNSERAAEVFTMAVNYAVMARLKEHLLEKAVLRDYLKSKRGLSFGKGLASEFIRSTGAVDQRRSRHLLRFLLGA